MKSIGRARERRRKSNETQRKYREEHHKKVIGKAYKNQKVSMGEAQERHSTRIRKAYKGNVLERHRKAQEKNGKGIGRRTRKHREGIGKASKKT